jgi:hypothetical protein
MSNRKLAVAAMLAAVVTFAVAACGPKPEEAAPPAETTTEAAPPVEMSAAPAIESVAPSVTP